MINYPHTSFQTFARIAGKRPAVVFFLAVLLTTGPAIRAADQSSSTQSVPITITGTVRSSAGDPVSGARVFLLEENSSETVETKTKPDGTFAFSVSHAGAYTVRVEKAELRGGPQPLLVAAGDTKHIDFVLAAQPSPPAMEFKDEPDFTVAGVTDWSNVGLHGSDTTSRTSEALAKETSTLKSGSPDKAPENPTGAKYKLAVEYRDQGDFVHAREQVRKALAAGDDAEGHRLLGDLDERLGDPLEAVREYERAARLYPSEQNYFDWGTELLLHKAPQPAIEVFTRGSGLHPDSSRMLAGLAAAFYAAGSYEEAARRLCAASALRPNDPSPYVFLGQIEKAAPSPLPCSEEKLARFARIQPANALANYFYAVALWKRERVSGSEAGSPKVETLLERAIALDPKLGEAYVQLGIVYFERNDSTRAIQSYQHAIAVNPQIGEAHYRLSLAYKRAGDDAKAHQEFEAYQEAAKTETAALERQRKELRQFLIILKNQPGASAHP